MITSASTSLNNALDSTWALKMLGLPNMQTIDELCASVKISKHALYQLSMMSFRHYKAIEIPKRDGTIRRISSPSKKLKGLQAWILFNILSKLHTAEPCKGFRKGSSILDNALPHIGARAICCVDILSFYEHISDRMVYNVFRAVGFNSLISSVLTRICTYKGSLPQGSPCSPFLANLVCWKIDARLSGFAGSKGMMYTRYADDITLSTVYPPNIPGALKMIRKIVTEEGFSLNKEKTRVTGPTKLRQVTGLVIGEHSVGIARDRQKRIRSMIYNAAKKNITLEQKELNVIKGHLAFINSVDKKRLAGYKKYIERLALRFSNSNIGKILDQKMYS